MKMGWEDFWSDRKVRVGWAKKRVAGVVEKYLKTDHVVLDAGCGSGFFSEFFIERGCRVFCLDYSKNALEMTKKLTENHAEEYLCHNLLDSHLAGLMRNRFDIIFSDGLLEHFSSDKQNIILQNFLKMKKKTGIIISFVPNKISFWRLLRPFLKLYVAEKPFSLKELVELHKYNNLEILESGGLNVLPFHISPEFLGARIGMLVYVAAR